MFKKFLADESAASAVEYSVMISLIIIVCLAAISMIGSQASVTFTSVGSSIGAS